MAVGLALTRVAKLIGLPNVTAFLVAGLVLRYSLPLMYDIPLSGVDVKLKEFDIITNVALGFIAFSIGSSFKLKHIKQIGKNVVVITFFQALTAVALVDVALLGCNLANLISVPAALCLGAIATATAPAATLMVVAQYKAKGPVTDTLLPVVAFDDAIGLVVFAISLAVAKALSPGAGTIATGSVLMNVLLLPLLEIILSLAIGAVIGIALAYSAKVFKSRANRISLCILAVFAGEGLVNVIPGIPLSDLLTCMAIGVCYVNINKESGAIMDIMDRWTAPLFMLFFIISGAGLDLTMIAKVGLIGLVYIIVRAFGKYGGAYMGAKLVRADRHVQNYLGLMLMPQAGVAIGMAQKIMNTSELGSDAGVIVTVTLCATIIYELVGPLLTKWALVRAGEIEQKPKTVNKKNQQAA